MLSIFVGDQLDVLANRLAEQLVQPLADPMQPELVAVPSVGLQRWLKLHLASSLGGVHGDGIAANIDMPFPGILRSRLFSADQGDNEDPWELSSLVWAVYSVLVDHRDDPQLQQIARLPDGATWYGRSRRIADLFDRYATRRTDLLRRWANGEDLDPTGKLLDPGLRWQPHLFRLVQAHIGAASPAERLSDLLAKVRAGELPLDLPERFSIFGVSTLPGGQGFADLLKAFGERHDVTLFMLDPALATSRRLAGEFDGIGELKRAEDRSAARVWQPLMRSWGRPSREAQLLLPRVGLPEVVQLQTPPGEPHSLLGALQHHIRSDAPAAGTYALSEDDHTIQLHACHGATRQVEVLHDVLLHALASDPTLHESDILVVSPDLPTFAPIIEGVLGPSADRTVGDWEGPERLRYTVSDRGLSTDDSLGAALLHLVGVVGSRYNASEILDFCRLAPVALAYGFDGDAIAQIESWLDATEIRWGLNQANRERNDLHGVRTNTWRHGLDQLLVGMAIHDDLPSLGPNDVPAWGVESNGVDVLNRLIAMMGRLEQLEEEWTQAAPVSVWNDRLSSAVADFFQLPFADLWQLERARTAIAQLQTDAERVNAASLNLTVVEVAQLLEERLVAGTARPRFFDGGITFTSTRPLRWVPHRMICVLGLDEASMTVTSPSGDDLLSVYPDIGDPDRRADQRQALLEVVLSATDQLVIVREGHSIKSNKEVPPCIAIAELLSELRALVHPDHRHHVGRLERQHSRHGFDVRNFDAEQPFSFDERALRAARARIEPSDARSDQRLAERTDPVLDLGALTSAVLDGPKHFFQRRIQASFPRVDEGTSDNLPVESDALMKWGTLSQLIDLERNHHPTDTLVATIQARGAYPAGVDSQQTLQGLQRTAQDMMDALDRRALGSPSEDIDIAITVDGVELVDRLEGVYPAVALGPILATASKPDERLWYALWVQLCALTLARPNEGWTAVGVSKNTDPKSDENAALMTIGLAGADAQERHAIARRVLASLLAIHRRAMAEPLPIHYKAKFETKGASSFIKNWEDGMFPGLQSDTYLQAAFGKITDAEFLSLPVAAHDVPLRSGSPRPGRFQHYRAVIQELWDASAVLGSGDAS